MSKTAAEWEQTGTHIVPNTIVLHHTCGPIDQTVDDIDAEHRANGWAGIGYEGIWTKASGVWEFHQGRPDDIQGAQAQGINSHSVGYSMCGNYQDHEPDDELKHRVVQDLAIKAKRMGITADRIILHRDVAGIIGDSSVATDCPGNAAAHWFNTVGRAAVAAYL